MLPFSSPGSLYTTMLRAVETPKDEPLSARNARSANRNGPRTLHTAGCTCVSLSCFRLCPFRGGSPVVGPKNVCGLGHVTGECKTPGKPRRATVTEGEKFAKLQLQPMTFGAAVYSGRSNFGHTFPAADMNAN